MLLKKRILAILVVSSLLVACGGGGGASTGNDNNKIVEKDVSVKAIKEISFRPELSEYSESLDKIIAYDQSLATLNIVSRLTGVTVRIPLSDSAEVIKLSPNGKKAIVIHPNHISYIDLEKSQLLKIFPNEGPYTDGFLTDQGIGFFLGIKDSQDFSNGVVKLNLNTGVKELQLNSNNFGFFSELKGIYSEKTNKIIFTYFDISPRDLISITLDKSSTNAISTKDSPYHGDYPIGGKLFFDQKHEYVYTSEGTYFYTANLNYGGRIKMLQDTFIISLIQDKSVSDLRVLPAVYGTWEQELYSYIPGYLKYSGYGYGVVTPYNLPEINGFQSYGIKLFQTADNKTLALVQIGSSLPYAANLKYYILTLQD